MHLWAFLHCTCIKVVMPATMLSIPAQFLLVVLAEMRDQQVHAIPDCSTQHNLQSRCVLMICSKQVGSHKVPHRVWVIRGIWILLHSLSDQLTISLVIEYQLQSNNTQLFVGITQALITSWQLQNPQNCKHTHPDSDLLSAMCCHSNISCQCLWLELHITAEHQHFFPKCHLSEHIVCLLNHSCCNHSSTVQWLKELNSPWYPLHRVQLWEYLPWASYSFLYWWTPAMKHRKCANLTDFDSFFHHCRQHKFLQFSHCLRKPSESQQILDQFAQFYSKIMRKKRSTHFWSQISPCHSCFASRRLWKEWM